MKRIGIAVIAMMVLTATTGRADTLPLILDVAPTYQPGTPFSFEVRVPNVADFTAYTIELIFDTGVADPDLTVSAAATLGQYPFPSVPTFPNGTSTGPGSSSVSLTLTDSTAFPGVLTFAGVNDLIALVTVTPGPSFTGPITIAVNPDTLSFDLNSEATPTVDAPQPITVEQGASAPEVVPTPAAWLSLSLGGLLLALRRRVLGGASPRS